MIIKIVHFIKRKFNERYKSINISVKKLEKYTINIKLASIITTIIIFGIMGTYINTGLGKVVDCSILIIIGLIILLLITLLVKVVLKVLIHFPKRIAPVLISTIIALSVIFENPFLLERWQAIISAILIVIVEVTLAINIGKLNRLILYLIEL
ncbi:MAG: hypothetical protein ACI8WT_000593 [Clostridium sp.]|jgi:hypothetical protein